MINDNPHKLNSNQMLFCHYMLTVENNDSIEAAKLAGYKNPKSAAAKLISNPDVIDTIIRLRDEQTKRTNITLDKVLLETAKLAFFNVDDVIEDISNSTLHEIEGEEGEERIFRVGRVSVKDFKSLPRHVKAAIISVKETKFGVEIRWHDKKDALDKLMRYFGAYNDKLALEGGDKPIKVEHDLSPEIKSKLSEIYNKE